MRLTYLTLQESFDRSNPWFVRITGLSFARHYRKDLMSYVFLIMLFLSLAVGWFAAFSTRDPMLIAIFPTTTYVVAVLLAFIAPALGAAARLRFDYDPLLLETLTTPITDRQILAAIHARILTQTFLATATASILGFGLITLLGHPDGQVIYNGINTYWLRLFLSLTRFREFINSIDPAVGLLALLLIVITTVDYGAGFYLHATVLVGYCHWAPNARFRGGLMTVGLVFLMMLTMLLQFLQIPHLLEAFPLVGRSMAPWKFLTFVLLFEVFLLCTRWALAYGLWKRFDQTAISETRRYVVGEA